MRAEWGSGFSDVARDELRLFGSRVLAEKVIYILFIKTIYYHNIINVKKYICDVLQENVDVPVQNAPKI